jgi:apolipoprotein N-acyltransferase
MKFSYPISYLFSFIFLSITAFCGWQMWNWAQEGQLFGNTTFFFIAAFWLTLLTLRLRTYNLRWLGFSTLSGVLLTLGFPNFPFTPLLFGAFIPLLQIEKEISAAKNQGHNSDKPMLKKQNRLLKYAFNTFIIWNIGSTWWVANAGLPAGMLANFLNALFMSWVFVIFHALTRKTQNTVLKYALFIALWIGFEFLHLNWEISWSWLTLGNAFAQVPNWVQWYEFTGVFGGSLWVLLANVFIFKILERFTSVSENKIPLLKTLTTVCFLFVVPFVISYFLEQKTVAFSARPDKKTAKIAAIQPNFEPHYEKFTIDEINQVPKFLALSERVLDSTTDYLLFPETSFEIRNTALWAENSIFQSLQTFLKKYPNLHLLTGVDALKVYAAYASKMPENLPPTVRTYAHGDGSATYFEIANAAVQLTGETKGDLDVYKKSKLVPGPEILPYSNTVFGFLKPLFKKFGGTVGGLTPQAARTAFKNTKRDCAIGTVICYESVFGEFCGGYARAGAEALVVLTNDGWWDNSPGYLQHLKFSSLRAIELRRSVVRSANTGSSCFIDPSGRVSQATAYATDAAIAQTVELRSDLTFYAQNGDFLARIACFLLILGVPYALYLNRRSSK